MFPAAIEVPRYEAPAPETPGKAERLHFRVSFETKAMLERASLLEGRSMTDFVVQKITEAAIQTIADHERVVLNQRERAAFFKAILHPPAPSLEEREAMRRSRKMFGDE